MIVELRIKNFKSFREEVVVSFAASTTSKLSGNLLRQRNGERVVKSMGLYGPNASGKTSILDAMYALKTFVLFSSQEQKPTSKIPFFEPFALEKTAANSPSTIGVTFDLDGDRFFLEVSATPTRVHKELLTVQRLTKQPSRKSTKTTLIDRTWAQEDQAYETVLHKDLAPDLTRAAAIEQTTQNRLLLGKLASMNSGLAGNLIKWFDDDLDFYDMHRNPGAESVMLTETAKLLRDDDQFSALIKQFMKDADIGIQDLQIVDEKTLKAEVSELDNKVEFKESIEPGISFRHSSQDGSVVFFPRHKESSGTLRFVALLVAILKPSGRRRFVCIDELSASMHPELVRRLIRIVHSSVFNQLGNQVMFTTHDTHLIEPTELLRRDQVTLCNKDRFGRSSLKRLDVYQDSARSDANLQKQYLQGRFGGTPQFGVTLEDVPVDDKPLEVCS